MREREHLERRITAVRELQQELDDAITLEELGEAEGDTDTVAEAQAALTKLRQRAGKMELQSLLSGEADANDAYLEVNAGAGGTEAQDWAEMLLRMYTRWAQDQGYKVELIDESQGEEAGLKSATIKVAGENAYGWLKGESGVHRLVRIPIRQSGTPPHLLRQRLGVSRHRRPDRGGGGGQGPARRHLPLLRRGRSAREHHRLGGTHHAHAHRHCGAVPDRALAAQEPRARHVDAALAPV
jgi:hypothetical protein